MKSVEIVSVMVRLFAIALFLKATQEALLLAEVFSEGKINGMEASPFILAVLSGTPLLIALILWFFPISVSSSLVKPEMDTPLTPLHMETLTIVTIVGLGIYVLSYSSSDLVYSLTWLHLESRSVDSGSLPSGYSPTATANLVATVFEIIFGLFLISRARYITAKVLELVR